MKAEELRDLSDDDLRGKIDELKESIFRMRFKLSLGNTDVVKQLRESRKDLARVKTLLREREIAAAQQNKAVSAS
jgi:large subunit ribosomal protein L29